MSETSLSNASATTSDHFNRAAAALKAAERDAHAAIDSAVDGLASGADRVFDKSRDIDQLVAYCIALSTRAPGDLSH